MKKTYFGIALICVFVFGSNIAQATEPKIDTIYCKQFVGSNSYYEPPSIRGKFKCYADGTRAWRVEDQIVNIPTFAGYYGYKTIHSYRQVLSNGSTFIEMKVSK